MTPTTKIYVMQALKAAKDNLDKSIKLTGELVVTAKLNERAKEYFEACIKEEIEAVKEIVQMIEDVESIG